MKPAGQGADPARNIADGSEIVLAELPLPDVQAIALARALTRRGRRRARSGQ